MGTHPIFESDFDCLTDMGRKPKNVEKHDVDPNYMKGTVSWADRLAKYAELSALEFYLTKYEEAFGWSATKFQEFQNTMDDDVERSDLLKKQMGRYFWSDADQKLAMQSEEKQYRLASSISSRAAMNKSEIRAIVQECGMFTKCECNCLRFWLTVSSKEFVRFDESKSLIEYIGEIIRERRKVEIENKNKRRDRLQKERINQMKQKQRINKEGQPRLAGSAIAPDMQEKRLQALQKIRELNAQRKAQRGDLNMF